MAVVSSTLAIFHMDSNSSLAMSRSAYVSRIRLFSVLLSEFKPSNVPLILSTKPRRDQVIFTHLATMLNTGRTVTQVVAVSGCIDSDGPKATVVVSSNPSGTTQIHDNAHPFTITNCNPSRALTAEMIKVPVM